MCPSKPIARRSFLRLLLDACIACLAAAAAYPVLRYLYPPKGAESSVSSVVAAKVGELSRNAAKIFRFGNRPGLLINTPEGTLKAFSAVCTHLNCTVQYQPDACIIHCACHNGKFDLNGQVISGPPPKPLPAYRVDVRGNEIVVSKPA